MSFLLAFQGAVAQGLLWAVLALGTYITFRLLNFPDMTIDGAFATGACVCAVGLVAGVHPLIAIIFALIAGGLAGLITGFLHTKLKIPEILAGILTQIALYSINLRILGRANQQLLKTNTLFKELASLFNSFGLTLSSDFITLLVGILVSCITIALLYWFFGTEIGAAIRATGNNDAMVRALGQSTNSTKRIALILANGLIGVSGALVAMYQGAADVGAGTGAIVIGLASIVIGEVLFPHARSFWAKLCAIALGSVVYRVLIALVLQLGFHTNDMKLLTAVLVAIALYLPQITAKRQAKKQQGA